jgi:hypothetical protein
MSMSEISALRAKLKERQIAYAKAHPTVGGPAVSQAESFGKAKTGKGINGLLMRRSAERKEENDKRKEERRRKSAKREKERKRKGIGDRDASHSDTSADSDGETDSSGSELGEVFRKARIAGGADRILEVQRRDSGALLKEGVRNMSN